MSKAPSIPKDQLSSKGPGGHSPPSRDEEVKHDPARGNAGVNLNQQGATANLRQNTTNARRFGA